jgi:hypothetical protein
MRQLSLCTMARKVLEADYRRPIRYAITCRITSACSGRADQQRFLRGSEGPAPIIRSLQWYKQQHSNPKVAMAKAYESGAYTLAQIAGHFAVH